MSGDGLTLVMHSWGMPPATRAWHTDAEEACFECIGRGRVNILGTVTPVGIAILLGICPRCEGSGKERR